MTAGSIGVVCEADHPVMSEVILALHERGHEVRRFDPGESIPGQTVRSLDALANKKIRKASFDALSTADRAGVPTWVGFCPTTALSCRLVALHALEAVGLRTPPVFFDPPAGRHVAKTRYAWDGQPELDGESDLYEPLLDTDRIDYKYYAVRTGGTVHIRTITVTSKLFGEREHVGAVDPVPELVAGVEDLLRAFDMGCLGVDFVHTDDDEFVAVDVNPAPSFRETELEGEITDSIAALVTDG